MVSRKRTRSDTDAAPEQPSQEPGLLDQLRNCWEFANLMQYITIFGKPMKIDEDFGIEDLETECLKPGPSEKLMEIGLCLLKWVSSHRGLSFDNFDEYTRRQYNAKAPHLENPFGYEEVPKKFADFDIFLKLRVLHQLTVWTFWNPDRIRDKMPEQREQDQTQWRIEEVGYDRDGAYYYILDDNRLYRRIDPPIPPPKPAKSKTKRKSARALRASKRRRGSDAAIVDGSSEEDNGNPNGELHEDPFKEMQWECVAITLNDYREFLASIQKTRDPDEKILRDRIEEQVMPVIEKEEEAQERQRIKKEKELINLQMLAGAKRSSRLAGKAERDRAEREAMEEARKHEAELAMARKEEEKKKKMEQERRARMMTREQRIKDRERRRLEHEAELQKIQDEHEKFERGESRMSERHLRAEMERQRKNLKDLSGEDEWIFDCSGCGVHGENLDDGSHSVACEKCNVWQHSKCLGIAQDEAEREDFHFVCKDCHRREEEAKMPKLPPLKFKLGSSPSSAPHEDHQAKGADAPHFLVPKMEAHHHMSPNGSPSKMPAQPSFPPQTGSQSIPFSPSSPARRPHSAHNLPFSPSRAPFSPSKGVNGFGQSRAHHPKPSSAHQTTQPPPGHGSFGSFQTHRPSSSHSAQSPLLPSPIQNRPSMSPTQGNRDVGPLAGFPSAPPSDSPGPWTTPFKQHQARRPSTSNHASFSSMQGGQISFAATPTASQSSPPQSSHGHGVHLSGISPTKQSPRPVTSGGMAGAPVLPPIQKLEPSPKLMGRSSPDAPIPPPVKSMTPEQEGRRQRENAMISHGAGATQGMMSSPSFNRIPSLGSATQNTPSAPQFHSTENANGSNGSNGQ